MTTSAIDSQQAEHKGKKAAKTTFFDRGEIDVHVTGEDGLVTALSNEPDSLNEMDIRRHLAGRLRLRVLLNQGPGGFSLVESDIAPGTRVPRHKHNVAQVALILEGSMRHGSRILGPGAGYFTPPNGAYSFVAGPEGCRYVEFRQGAAVEEITTDILEQDPARWAHES